MVRPRQEQEGFLEVIRFFLLLLLLVEEEVLVFFRQLIQTVCLAVLGVAVHLQVPLVVAAQGQPLKVLQVETAMLPPLIMAVVAVVVHLLLVLLALPQLEETAVQVFSQI